jgi:hypothetical protein
MRALAIDKARENLLGQMIYKNYPGHIEVLKVKKVGRQY